MYMEQLKTGFKKNDIDYTILERTATRYFAELRSMESGMIIGYETGKIIRTKAKTATISGKTINFKGGERIISNEQFGFDKFECFLPPRLKDEVYQQYLNGIEKDK
jgi:hypothetical protein